MAALSVQFLDSALSPGPVTLVASLSRFTVVTLIKAFMPIHFVSFTSPPECWPRVATFELRVVATQNRVAKCVQDSVQPVSVKEELPLYDVSQSQ